MTNKEIEEILLEEFNRVKTINGIHNWRSVTKKLISSLKDVDLSINLLPHDPNSPRLKKLEDDTIFDDNFRRHGGVCELNPIAKERILSDLYLISINSFYPTVIKQLIESNILDTNDGFNKVFLTIFYHRQHNRRTKITSTTEPTSIYSPEFHTFCKQWLNYTFGVICNPRGTSKYRQGNTIDVKKYAREIFKEIISNFTWVYVDTDEIYCYLKDKRSVGDVFYDRDLSFGIKALGYSYFISKKKFLIVDGIGSITSQGIKEGTELEARGGLISMYRDDRINEILN